MRPLKNAPFRSLCLSAQSLRCVRPAEAGLEISNPAVSGIPVVNPAKAGLTRLGLERN